MSAKQREPAPFLKWVGGKRKLLPQILACIPTDFDPSKNRFFEPFVGGGAVMFALGVPEFSKKVPGSKLTISDMNPDLISTYIAVRDEVEELIDALTPLTKKNNERDFERIRASCPTNPIEVAARTIYLNKTCFNGLWRVNADGIFNTPFGRYPNPTILDAELLRACSERLQKATILQTPFSASVEKAKEGDLVYIDPPYIPLSATSSFASYSKSGFGLLDQYALAGVIQGLTVRGVKVIFSNSNTPLTSEVFGRHLRLHPVTVNRSIAAKSSSRGNVQEVIGTNFPLPAAARNLLK